MVFLGIKCLPFWMFILLMTSFTEQSISDSCPITLFASIVRMFPCRPAVAPFSLVSPTKACCSALKALGQPCLCVLVNGPPISGVDRDLAVLLPEKCAVNFDPCEVNA